MNDLCTLARAPGFIDLHLHGLHEHRVDDGPEDLLAICRLLPRYGVTSFLPTLLPRPPGEDAAFLARLAAIPREGSQILGFHLEGPFLTLPGAIPPEALGKADPARVLGCAGRKGRIADGFDADLVLLDEELKVARTWVGGEDASDS